VLSKLISNVVASSSRWSSLTDKQDTLGRSHATIQPPCFCSRL